MIEGADITSLIHSITSFKNNCSELELHQLGQITAENRSIIKRQVTENLTF